MDLIKYNKDAWNRYVKNNNRWTVPVSEKEINNSQLGKWSVVLTPSVPVPRTWFPEKLNKVKILGLACGGGQQGPILASQGADVTIFDNSPLQLKQDEKLSNQYNLNIKTIEGDMRDLSMFEDESFDLIFNPCSIGFVDDITNLWNQCYRILKKGGILMAGLTNPLIFQIDESTLKLQYKSPYSDQESLSDEDLNKLTSNHEPLMFGHSWTEQLGNQLKAGFILTDLFEDDWNKEHIFDSYFPGFMATRAIKLE